MCLYACSCRTYTVACIHFAPGISHTAHIFRSFTLGACCSHSTFLCIIQTKSLLDTCTHCFTPNTAHIIQFTRSWTLVVVPVCSTLLTPNTVPSLNLWKDLTFAVIWIQHFSHHTLCNHSSEVLHWHCTLFHAIHCTSLVVLCLQIYSYTTLFTPYIMHTIRKKFHSHHTLCTSLIRSFTLVHCTFHTIHCAHHSKEFHTHTALFTPYNIWVCEWNFLQVVSTVWTSLIISFTLKLHFSHHTLCTLLKTFNAYTLHFPHHANHLRIPCFHLAKKYCVSHPVKKSFVNLLHACFTFYEKYSVWTLCVLIYTHKGLSHSPFKNGHATRRRCMHC